MAYYQIALVGIILVIAVAATRSLPSKRNKIPPPPGPRGLPVVGNINDLAPKGAPEFRHWMKFKDLYGPISSICVMGQRMIFIHDPDVSFKLMDGLRGANHSGRGKLFFGSEMVGWADWVLMQGYTALTKAYRRDFHGFVGTKSIVQSQYSELQSTEARRFLLRVQSRPEKIIDHIRTALTAIILDITYGYKIELSGEDPLISLAERVMAEMADTVVPGRWLVDFFPWLSYLPDWVPGISFKQTARTYALNLRKLAELPYAFAKSRIDAGEETPNMVSKLLEKHVDSLDADTLIRIKRSAASVYAGAADTSNATLQWFFLAMLLNPSVQQKAQEEIDRVIGSDRLPTFEDRESLPYIGALQKEVFRWNTIGPMGVPHATEKDDVLTVKTAQGDQEYSIPAGSILMSDVWWFLRDPARYHKPDSFSPERFMGDKPEQDPYNVAFGFGRRSCPGKNLADASIWLLIAHSIATLNIERVKDANGRPVPIDIEGVNGLMHHPKPFQDKVHVTVRESAKELMERLEKEESWDESDADLLNEIDASLNYN